MLEPILLHVTDAVVDAAIAIAVPAPIFIVLGFLVKGRQLARDVIRAASESQMNILMHFTDSILVAPITVLLSAAMYTIFHSNNLSILPSAIWETMHPAAVGFVALFIADFVGYWRHRIEHTPLLWPSHAVHHSDTQMTWLAIFRFHPINRLTTVIIDFSVLFAMGLPIYAILVASLVRHYYGAFIHADLPWTFGPLRYLFVSPAMHRWHHANDRKAYNTNYATVFSIFDLAFGTFRLPGPCNVSQGVPETIGRGLLRQLAYPLKPSSYRYFRRRLAKRWEACTAGLERFRFRWTPTGPRAP